MKVKILTPVLHDDKEYKKGDTLEADKATCEALILAGAAEKVVQKEEQPKK